MKLYLTFEPHLQQSPLPATLCRRLEWVIMVRKKPKIKFNHEDNLSQFFISEELRALREEIDSFNVRTKKASRPRKQIPSEVSWLWYYLSDNALICYTKYRHERGWEQRDSQTRSHGNKLAHSNGIAHGNKAAHGNCIQGAPFADGNNPNQ